jgi:hypothetical protein
MKPPAVVLPICLAFLRRHLSGFRFYPKTEAGETRFAEALQLNAVSVEHLEAVLQCFDEEFPTVRQIHDAASNLRVKFEPAVDPLAEWERQYGKPEAFQLYPADTMAMHWQAFRDMLYYTEGPAKDMKDASFWDVARFKGLKDHPDSIAFVRHQIKTHGWPAIMQMAASPEPMPYKKPNPFKNPKGFVPVASRITQADIDRVLPPRKTTDQVDAELDQWEDPDR